MSETPSVAQTVAPTPAAAWLTEHRRYFDYLDVALGHLTELSAEISATWPEGGAEFIAVDALAPELHTACRRRDLLGDAIPIFAAMSVEAFVNLYGVVALGEEAYYPRLERRHADEKLKILARKVDSVRLSGSDEILQLLRHIMRRRNAIAHPKARELPADADPIDWRRDSVVERSALIVDDCRRFFELVRTLLPSARPLLPVSQAS